VIFVGRPSRWGNPFSIGRDGDRATVIKKHRSWIVTQPKLMRGLGDLRGKDLACWCSLDQPCHAGVLLDVANSNGIEGEN